MWEREGGVMWERREGEGCCGGRRWKGRRMN